MNQTCIWQEQAQEFGIWTSEFFYGLLDHSLLLRLLNLFFENILLEPLSTWLRTEGSF